MAFKTISDSMATAAMCDRPDEGQGRILAHWRQSLYFGLDLRTPLAGSPRRPSVWPLAEKFRLVSVRTNDPLSSDGAYSESCR